MSTTSAMATNPRDDSYNHTHPLQAVDGVACIKSCRGRQEICRQGQPATTWFRVLSGTALCYVIRTDGRRQIVDLLLPGEFFGFCAGAEYDYSVEAVPAGMTVAAYPRKKVEAAALSNPQLIRAIQQIAFSRLSRLQQQLLIIGRVRVNQKVGSFIVAMADRLSHGSSDRVTLPVSRYEIADYLAVSVETVSRALSELKQRGLIRFLGTRTIQILDREALEDSDCEDERHLFTLHRPVPPKRQAEPLPRTDAHPAGPSSALGEPQLYAR